MKLISFAQNLVVTRSAGLFRSAEYRVDGWNILGELTNSALLANYKDIVNTVSYFSQTKTLIDKKDLFVYEYIKPNSSIGFNLKVNPPDATDDIKLEIKSMTPTDRKQRKVSH